MTQEQQQVIDNANAQNELVKQSLRHDARRIALDKSVNLNPYTGLTRNADEIIEDAEKIYQWLIKDL